MASKRKIKIGPAHGTVNRITPSGPGYSTEAETIAAIIAESTKAANDAGGRPLPLAANWHRVNLPLSWQLAKIADGYPLLPWFGYEKTGTFGMDDLAGLASSGLPVTLITGGQPEADLYTLSQFTSLSDADTAQVVTSTGRASSISPMGTTTAWTDLGTLWGDTATMASIQSTYAAPPRVFYAMNNEASYKSFYNAYDDTRYESTYGAGQTEAQRTSNWHYRLIDRWGAFKSAFETSFDSSTWQSNWNLVAYDSQCNRKHQVSNTWYRDSARHAPISNTLNRTQWQWYTLDGQVAESYDNNWEGGAYYAASKATFLVWSPQNEAMNFAWQYETALTVNPDYWFELIVWDGDMLSGGDNDGELSLKAIASATSANPIAMTTSAPHGYSADRTVCFTGLPGDFAALNNGAIYNITITGPSSFTVAADGTGFAPYTSGGYAHGTNKPAKHAALRNITGVTTADHYKGWTQYCLWVTKARVLREFRYSDDDVLSSRYLSHWEALIDAVSHVHQNTTLRRFWREGTLLEHPTRRHPFERGTESTDGSFTGSVWSSYPKWYHLPTDLDPALPSSGFNVDNIDHNLPWPVYTLGMVIGTTPNREWLVYAHSTGISGSTLTDVQVTIPNYQAVTLPSVPLEGAFYYVVE